MFSRSMLFKRPKRSRNWPRRSRERPMGIKVEFPTKREYWQRREQRDVSLSGTLSFRDNDNDSWQSPVRYEKIATIVRFHGLAMQQGIILSLGLLIAIACLTPPPAVAQVGQQITGAERIAQPAPNLRQS